MPFAAILLALVFLAWIGQPIVVPGNQAGARATCGPLDPRPGSGLRPPDGWLIPADSVATLYAFRNLVFSHPRMSGPYPRSVVMVLFQPAATLEERLSAFELVQGRLVGGMGNDYLLVIDDDGTADPLWAAVDKLCTLPQVFDANPEIVTLGVVSPEDPGGRPAAADSGSRAP